MAVQQRAFSRLENEGIKVPEMTEREALLREDAAGARSIAPPVSRTIET